mmetsp:Transcript_5932/g.9403  ORF Transcript_5932/g.9403 Transcript_5932/m.9403 type:complete len:235 (-) Transcript_5932:714-1418(-)
MGFESHGQCLADPNDKPVVSNQLASSQQHCQKRSKKHYFCGLQLYNCTKPINNSSTQVLHSLRSQGCILPAPNHHLARSILRIAGKPRPRVAESDGFLSKRTAGLMCLARLEQFFGTRDVRRATLCSILTRLYASDCLEPTTEWEIDNSINRLHEKQFRIQVLMIIFDILHKNRPQTDHLRERTGSHKVRQHGTNVLEKRPFDILGRALCLSSSLLAQPRGCGWIPSDFGGWRG